MVLVPIYFSKFMIANEDNYKVVGFIISLTCKFDICYYETIKDL